MRSMGDTIWGPQSGDSWRTYAKLSNGWMDEMEMDVVVRQHRVAQQSVNT